MPEYPQYDQGQGSGHAGTTWLFERNPMMETIEKTCTGLDITSLDHSLSYTLHIIRLVDDKQQYANNWKDHSEKKYAIIYKRQQVVGNKYYTLLAEL